jgi:hypothetical protein
MSQRTNRKAGSMSALPSPRPRKGQKVSRKEAARAIAQLLEEHMDQMGFSETEKNVRTSAFAESVQKLKASRSGTPSK